MSSAADPLVSVVLPTYDRPEMLRRAINSVAAQTYPEIELVVVDDASPTPVCPVVERTAPEELQWQCLRHDQNQGANAARNTGIEAASGEILAFIDDDDRWQPAKLDEQVSVFQERGNGVGAVIVGQRTINGAGVERTIMPDISADATRDLLTGGTAGTFSTIAVRRSAVAAAGLPDERFPAWQDREWLVRLSKQCALATIREPLTIRQFGDYEQISNDFEGLRDRMLPLFVEKHRDTAAELGCEETFMAVLNSGVASAGLVNGYYSDARRLALTAIRHDPRLPQPYQTLLLALGGQYTYGAALKLNRLLERLKSGRERPQSGGTETAD